MEKKKVFVIMPFQEVFFEVYEMLKEEFIDEFEFSNANDEGNPQNILRDVIQPIYESEIVLADLTGLNPSLQIKSQSSEMLRFAGNGKWERNGRMTRCGATRQQGAMTPGGGKHDDCFYTNLK